MAEAAWEELLPLLLAMLLGGEGLAGLDDDWASVEPPSASDAEPPGVMEPGPVSVAAAAIAAVEIGVLESNPPQYIVDLVTVQPDRCHTLFSWESERVGETITITVLNEVAEEVDCTQEVETTKASIPLGDSFTPGLSYTVIVNGEPHTFGWG